MSFIDWDGDGKITMADDMIDFMVYEDVMREEESERLFPKRSKSARPPKAPKPPKADPAPKAELDKAPSISVSADLDWPEKPNKDEINEAIKKSDRKDHRKKVIKRIIVLALLLAIAFCYADFRIGKHQMEKGIEELWKGGGELDAIRHFQKAGLLIRQPGAQDMINLCYAQYAYVDEKDYTKALMYAREIDENVLLRVDITSAVAYELLEDGLSKHFKGSGDDSALPYVGMPEDDLNFTSLGKADRRSGWDTIEVNGREISARAYDYYNQRHEYLFTAWCFGDKVVAIEDHTAKPLNQNPHIPETPKPTYKVKPKSTQVPSGGWYDPGWTTHNEEDPYDASEYSNPDDFYDDHYDDFYDYDEAEEYWIEHEYDD